MTAGGETVDTLATDMEIKEEEKLFVRRLALLYRENEQVRAQRGGYTREIREIVMELAAALGPLWILLDETLEILKLENQLFEPLEAYRRGKACAGQGAPYLIGFRAFLTEFSAAVQKMDDASSGHWQALYKLMKRTGTTGLLMELREACGQAYGGLARNAEYFFRLGYERAAIQCKPYQTWKDAGIMTLKEFSEECYQKITVAKGLRMEHTIRGCSCSMERVPGGGVRYRVENQKKETAQTQDEPHVPESTGEIYGIFGQLIDFAKMLRGNGYMF